MGDCEFHTGPSLGKCIEKVTQGSNFRAAVAFWGLEALMYPLNSDSSSLYYCDLLSGGTNPRVIREIGINKFRHVPNLHAKVYCSNEGTVVCSANFSNNGLKKNIEAGVYYSDNRVSDSLFDICSKNSMEIDAEMMQLAKEAFRKASSTNSSLSPNNSELPESGVVKLKYSEYRKQLRKIFFMSGTMKTEFIAPIGSSKYKFRVWDLRNENRFLIEIVNHLRARTEQIFPGYKVSGLVGRLNGRLVLLHNPDGVNTKNNKPILRNPSLFEGKEWSTFHLESEHFIQDFLEYELTRPESKKKSN